MHSQNGPSPRDQAECDEAGRLSALRKVIWSWITEIGDFLRQTIQSFLDDNAVRMAAALAFYTMFSIVPALLMALNIAGFVIGNSRAETELMARFRYVVNPESAEYVLSLLNSLSSQLQERNLSIIAILGAIITATGVFVELQSSLNEIWGLAHRRRSGFMSVLRARVVSFVCVVGIGVLILVAVVSNTVFSMVSSFFENRHWVPSWIMASSRAITQFGMIPVLLVLAYRLIPDRDIAWTDVLLGSIVASFLFALGKKVFAMYIGSSILRSIYGAAGSLFLLLVWVYYSAYVFYFGAELTKVYAIRYGSRAKENLDSNGALSVPPQ
jgi:membrane protein